MSTAGSGTSPRDPGDLEQSAVRAAVLADALPWLQRFASDEAHARWWAVHDRIEPKELATRFCALAARQTEALEYHRRQAEMANANDMHWNRTITDPRKLFPLQMPPTA